MPNWCMNKLAITGPEATITALWDTIINEHDGNLLSACAPLPEDGYGDGCDNSELACLMAACQTWRTKTTVNVNDKHNTIDWYVVEGVGKGVIFGSFDTAWTPPTKALETLCARYPDIEVRLTYLEPGMNFAGIFEANADAINDDEIDLSVYARYVDVPARYRHEIDMLADHFDLIETMNEMVEYPN